MKIITLSFDDGEIYDVKLIKLLRKYNLKATFNLCSSYVGKQGILKSGRKWQKVEKKDLKKTYTGFEIASHGDNHTGFKKLNKEQIVQTVKKDVEFFGKYTDSPIVCCAYPGGKTSKRVINVLRESGIITFARTTPKRRYSFDPPKDPLNIAPTCSLFSKKVFDVIENFKSESEEGIKILHLFEHSYNFEFTDGGWEKLEKIFKELSDIDGALYMTNGEAYTYAFFRGEAVTSSRILLPKNKNLLYWSCIACDQFTSEKSYWNELDDFVGNNNSTLRLTLPEIYLNGTEDERIEEINATMDKYIKDGVFEETGECFILTVRKTPYVDRRIGLVGAIDLEKYEYGKKSNALIRSTEGTIEERIPPRLKIRKKAKIEFPHVMVLFDDDKRSITEQLYKRRKQFEKLYDFGLNMGGGHLTGYKVTDTKWVVERFKELLKPSTLIKKYGKVDEFLFAVGDGNHSLATAKTHWDKLKNNLTEQEKLLHPARYALCEFVNVYDEGIYFEPIHRFVSDVNCEKFITGLKKVACGNVAVYDGKVNKITGKENLPDGIRAIDSYISEYLKKFGGKVDYVHGDKNVKKLVDSNKKSVGILFEKMDKKDLFKYVSSNGALPRKTFSMGEAKEKRYYLEGKKIAKW